MVFLMQRTERTFPTGTYKTAMIVKVDDSTAAYVTAASPEIGLCLLGHLDTGPNYEPVAIDQLSDSHYMRPYPFKVFLLPSLEVAESFARDRGGFGYERYLHQVTSLKPLVMEPYGKADR
jgi:hypothetical protein